MPVLTIRAESAPLERVRADLIVIAIAPGDRPLRGMAAHVDWRLCGQLSRWVAQGKLSGQRDTATLVALAAGFSSRRLVVLGLGSRSSLDDRVWREIGHETIDRARLLGAQRIALGVLDDEPDRRPTDALRNLLTGAADAVQASGCAAQLSLLGAASAVALAELEPEGAMPRGSAPADAVDGASIANATRLAGLADEIPRGVELRFDTTPPNRSIEF